MLPSITIFNKVISLYTIMALLGILFCGWYIIRVCKKRKIDDNQIIVVLLIACIGVFLGSHILYGLTNFDLMIIFVKNFHKIDSFKLFFDCIFEIFGGSVFYGGLIGGLISAYVYIKVKKLDKDFLTDLLTPLIPLFHVFGRIGCFLSGCCYGIESKLGFVYKHSLMEGANGINRFPIQLIEASYNLILFIILTILYKQGKFKGNLIYIYLILYPVGRFIFEFFRGDSYRGFIFGLSTSQFISILLLIFSISMLVIKRKKNS